jgi:hypothetical protein
MVAPLGSTQKFVNPPEDVFGVDAIFNDIYQNPNFVEPFGLGLGAISREGNIFRQVLAATGVSPGATAADNVIGVFSIPANSFDIAGRGIAITAAGKFATNANTKQVKIIFNPSTAVVGATVGSGGTTVADSGAQTGSNVGWLIGANIFKLGAAGANTQYGQCSGVIEGCSHIGVGTGGLPQFPTAAENAAILLAITGNATTTATDIVMNFFEVNAMN